uniref:Uncharacterized protein n=1 Tax=Arundo donax TaxID=35708 RepID=A0A0A9F4A4_ARUDO
MWHRHRAVLPPQEGREPPEPWPDAAVPKPTAHRLR